MWNFDVVTLNKIAMSTILVAALSGCEGRIFAFLGTNYYLENSDNEHVYLVRADTNSIAIDQQVVDYYKIQSYIFVLRMKSTSVECEKENADVFIITKKTNVEEYFILDLDKNAEIGPLDRESFFNKLNIMSIENVSLKVPSNYKGNEEYFDKIVRECRKVTTI
jgi:hypothetical protein